MLSLLLIAVALVTASPPGEARVLGRSAEISVGRETASMVEQFYAVDRDPVATARVQRIGRRLAAASGERRFPFEFHVVESPEINAFALPGGFIYIFRGLLQLLPDDDALAFVVAHELVHTTRRHALKQFEKNVLLNLGLTAVLAGGGRRWARTGDAVAALASLSFTRGDETEADEEGIKLLAAAGFDPRAASRAMEVILRTEPPGAEPVALLRSHPVTSLRVERLRTAGAGLALQRSATRRAEPGAPPVAPRNLAGLPAATAPCDFFPLATGRSWTYRITDGKSEAGLVVRVMERVDAGGPRVMRLEHDYLNGVVVRRLTATTADSLLVQAGQDAAEWEETARFEPAAPREEVMTPAGRYSALKVAGPDGAAWYAPGVGLVRQEAGGVVQELLAVGLPPPGQAG